MNSRLIHNRILPLLTCFFNWESFEDSDQAHSKIVNRTRQQESETKNFYLNCFRIILLSYDDQDFETPLFHNQKIP